MQNGNENKEAHLLRRIVLMYRRILKTDNKRNVSE